MKGDVLKANPPPTHNAKRCACDRCDPGGGKTAKARERWAAEREAAQKARAALGAPPAPETRPRPLRYAPRPPANDTRRLAELLREGKRFAEAAEIIEAEKHQPKEEPTP